MKIYCYIREEKTKALMELAIIHPGHSNKFISSAAIQIRAVSGQKKKKKLNNWLSDS